MSEITLFTCSLTVVRSTVGVMTSLEEILVWWVSVFWGQMLHTARTYVYFLSFGTSWWNINSMVLVPACDFHPCDRRPSSLHIQFFHTGVSLLIMSVYPNNVPVISQRVWFSVGFTVIVYFRVYNQCHDLPVSEVLFLLYSPLEKL